MVYIMNNIKYISKFFKIFIFVLSFHSYNTYANLMTEAGESSEAKFYWYPSTLGESEFQGYKSFVILMRYKNKQTNGTQSVEAVYNINCKNNMRIVGLQRNYSGSDSSSSELSSFSGDNQPGPIPPHLMDLKRIVCSSITTNIGLPIWKAADWLESKNEKYKSNSLNSTVPSSTSDPYQTANVKLSINDILADVNFYSGKTVILPCEPIEISSSGSAVTCRSNSGSYISINRSSMQSKQVRYLLDRCVNSNSCIACAIGKIDKDGSSAVLKNTTLHRLLMGQCFINQKIED